MLDTDSVLASDQSLSLYVHVPWCVKKCPYCDFNSHALANHSQVPDWAPYLGALKQDLQAQIKRFNEWAQLAQRQLISIFIGGGTPSVLPPEFYESLLCDVRAQLRCHPEMEVTIEANPGRLDQAHLQGYFDVGINRLSIGVQSFQAEALNHLGRIHSADQAEAAIEHALAVGFERINVDLMMGLPEQGVRECVADLKKALAFPITHLSWYQLTLEPNTAFYRTPPPLPTEGVIDQMFQAGQAYFAEQGFTAYEVSAYAKQPDHRSVHNRQYWRFGDYLGIGAGAHGKLTDPKTRAVVRTRQHKMPPQYQSQVQFPHVVDEVKTAELPFEYALNVWRLRDVFSVNDFETRLGLSKSCIEAPLAEAVRLGLIVEEEENVFRKTALGERFLNDLVGLFCGG